MSPRRSGDRDRRTAHGTAPSRQKRKLGLVAASPRRVMSELLLDRAGRPRSPATMPGFHAGRPPSNKGLRYPADPPHVEVNRPGFLGGPIR
jgi:hypothetical protein